MSTTTTTADDGERGLVMCRQCQQLVRPGTTWDVETPDGFPYPFCSPSCLRASQGWHHP